VVQGLTSGECGRLRDLNSIDGATAARESYLSVSVNGNWPESPSKSQAHRVLGTLSVVGLCYFSVRQETLHGDKV
jgi:hypothetical protein